MKSLVLVVMAVALLVQLLPSQVEGAVFQFKYTCNRSLKDCNTQCKSQAAKTSEAVDTCTYDKGTCGCDTKPVCGPTSCVGKK
ncbi:hypothetical protein BV898_13035 [Hypsibius exemplaris]|uniref:Uncharacterized protein n=1 Tax=Hypsibius exemplaris TaxID=2072580 RepID=A0A1W0WBX8_HYPEX|nr:hypothetical protein BV898_13035 [Hypsibius exemplaris]